MGFDDENLEPKTKRRAVKALKVEDTARIEVNLNEEKINDFINKLPDYE